MAFTDGLYKVTMFLRSEAYVARYMRNMIRSVAYRRSELMASKSEQLASTMGWCRPKVRYSSYVDALAQS